MTKNVVISIRLSEDEREELKKYSKLKELDSYSILARAYIRKGLRNEKR